MLIAVLLFCEEEQKPVNAPSYCEQHGLAAGVASLLANQFV